MNISDITANLNISTYTQPSAWDKIKSLPTSAELMVILMQKDLENPPGKTAEAAKSNKVDIIT